MERIKVLHIIGGGEFGGAEQYMLTLAKHINKSEVELHVACLFEEPLAPLVKKLGVPAHVFPMRNKLDLKTIGEVASLIKMEGFHIVHTHGVRANLIGRVAAKKAGVKHVVTTVHSILKFDYTKWTDRFFNSICDKVTEAITEKFITVSEMLAQELIKAGIPQAKIVTVYNGLELEKYNANISGLPVRQAFGVSGDEKLLGIVARLHPVKGHLYLFEAMARLTKNSPKIKLLVVGTGPERPHFEEMVAQLNIKSKVIFAGFQKNIPEIIAALDLLVLPSLSEGLGLAVMEGMAMGKAVLATKVGGIPEIITSGVDGLLVPPADFQALAEGIQQLLQSDQMMAQFGDAARRTIETRFSAGLMAEKTAKVYKDLYF